MSTFSSLGLLVILKVDLVAFGVDMFGRLFFFFLFSNYMHFFYMKAKAKAKANLK